MDFQEAVKSDSRSPKLLNARVAVQDVEIKETRLDSANMSVNSEASKVKTDGLMARFERLEDGIAEVKAGLARLAPIFDNIDRTLSRGSPSVLRHGNIGSKGFTPDGRIRVDLVIFGHIDKSHRDYGSAQRKFCNLYGVLLDDAKRLADEPVVLAMFDMRADWLTLDGDEMEDKFALINAADSCVDALLKCLASGDEERYQHYLAVAGTIARCTS